MHVTMEDVLSVAHNAKHMPVYPDKRFPPSLYYRFLQALCSSCSPNLCIELGLCGGGGSLHMCIGTPGTVIGIDISRDYPENIAYIRNRFSNFKHWVVDSIDAADMVVGKVDVLFIDTVHTYERTLEEYNAWTPHMNDGAVICLDDLHRPGMDKAWEEMPEPKVRMDWLHLGGSPTDGGFGVVLL